jgi:hypothetical protein
MIIQLQEGMLALELRRAAKEGDIGSIRFLLREGADIAHEDPGAGSQYSTALGVANLQFLAVNYLLDNGAHDSTSIGRKREYGLPLALASSVHTGLGHLTMKMAGYPLSTESVEYYRMTLLLFSRGVQPLTDRWVSEPAIVHYFKRVIDYGTFHEEYMMNQIDTNFITSVRSIQ